MNQPMNCISDADVQVFNVEGAVLVRGLIPSQWLAVLESGFEAMKAAADDFSDYYADGPKLGAAGKSQTLVRQDTFAMSAAMRDFLFEAPVARAAATLLSSAEVRLYEDLMIFKSAGAEQPTPWHQDEPQWPVRGRQMCSAWFCLDPVTSATGALRFASGSHNGPLYRPVAPANRRSDLDADNRYFDGGALPDVAAQPQRFPVVSYETQPGDVVLFHPRLLHAAFGSAPDYPRRTFSIRSVFVFSVMMFVGVRRNPWSTTGWRRFH
jgi:ectoine hydroxylase-related dioxygenase (phytanoyl-CoA dioxygenase family)